MSCGFRPTATSCGSPSITSPLRSWLDDSLSVGSRCPEHRAGNPRKFGRTNASRDRTSTAAHRRRRIVVLQNANWRCQIAREDCCTGRATVYGHRIGVRMLDLIPPAIRPTRAELDEMWNAQAACEPCSRWKASMEGHYAAGHGVECAFDLAIIPERIRNRSTSSPSMPRSIRLSYTDSGAEPRNDYERRDGPLMGPGRSLWVSV